MFYFPGVSGRSRRISTGGNRTILCLEMETDEQPTPDTNNGHPKASIFDVVNARIRANRVTRRVRSKLEKNRNMHYIRQLSRAKLLSKTDRYEPKVSERFLEEWLDFPRHNNHFVLFNTVRLMTRWLLWTNKSIASLDPSNPSIRDRLSNTIAQLSTASGLFLVMAVACFTIPPGIQLPSAPSPSCLMKPLSLQQSRRTDRQSCSGFCSMCTAFCCSRQ